MSEMTRRRVLAWTPALAAIWLHGEAAVPDAAPELDASFPTQPPDVVREVVGAAHGNLARVRELVERRPSLARATWDWGFGDWESALDAASHVGNREIAEYLIARGARPTIFTAAMLGHAAAVRAAVAAFPGIQRTTGPHGLTLVHHARAGGAASAEVLKYLESLGDADPRPVPVAITDAERTMLVGSYVFGPGPRDRVEIVDDRGSLGFERVGTARRRLTHVGDYAFFPVGAPAVRIRFGLVEGKVTSLAVHDPDVVMTARRT